MTQMQQQLSAVPIRARRRAAIGLVAIAVLLLVVGILPWTAPAPTTIRVTAIAALVAGVIALFIAWGLARSVSLDQHRTAEAELDAVLRAEGGAGCDCGGNHGPEAHPGTATECATPGEDAACAHDCAACVLARR